MKAVAKPKAKLQAVAKTAPKVVTKPKTKRAVTKDVAKTVLQPSTEADIDVQTSDYIVLEPEEEGCIEGEEAVAFFERSMGQQPSRCQHIRSNDGLPPVGQFRRDDMAMLRRNDTAIVARLVWAPSSYTLEILGLPKPVNMLILAYAGSKWKCRIKVYEDGIVRHIWHPHMDRWTKTLVQQSILKAHHDDTKEGY